MQREPLKIAYKANIDWPNTPVHIGDEEYTAQDIRTVINKAGRIKRLIKLGAEVQIPRELERANQAIPDTLDDQGRFMRGLHLHFLGGRIKRHGVPLTFMRSEFIQALLEDEQAVHVSFEPGIDLMDTYEWFHPGVHLHLPTNAIWNLDMNFIMDRGQKKAKDFNTLQPNKLKQRLPVKAAQHLMGDEKAMQKIQALYARNESILKFTNSDLAQLSARGVILHDMQDNVETGWVHPDNW